MMSIDEAHDEQRKGVSWPEHIKLQRVVAGALSTSTTDEFLLLKP